MFIGKKFIFISIGMFLCFINQLSFADNEKMNETFARIHQLLSQINPLINLAQSQQSSTTAIPFQFERLREDIDKIQAGLKEQMQGVTIEARIVEPLSGDYLSN